uniref:Uncharacterized protein n=1 Tax=Salix viminalis TaxID=40686 RepID=A0A6N2KM61_SALVM
MKRKLSTHFLYIEEGNLLDNERLSGVARETWLSPQEAATRILARQLVRLRQQITNLQGSRAQIRGVATHTQVTFYLQNLKDLLSVLVYLMLVPWLTFTGSVRQHLNFNWMKGATKAMVAMNMQMAPAKQAKVIREFQKQSAQMDMTIEMMSEAIDETLDKDEVKTVVTNQVLDEIGVDIASQLSSAPKGRIASKNAPNAVTSNTERKRKINRERCKVRWYVEGVQVYCYIQVELLTFVVLYAVLLPPFLLLFGKL